MRLELQSQKKKKSKENVKSVVAPAALRSQQAERQIQQGAPSDAIRKTNLLGSAREPNILSRRPDPGKNTPRLALQT